MIELRNLSKSNTYFLKDMNFLRLSDLLELLGILLFFFHN